MNLQINTTLEEPQRAGALNGSLHRPLLESPKLVLQNTAFVDVTDDYCLMERANWLAAEGYAPLTNPLLGLTTEGLVRTLSHDEYQEQGHARTIAALTTDPATGVTEMTGRARVVIGALAPLQQGLPPIEAMTFVEPLDGWPHAPSYRTNACIGEVSRFTIAPKYCTSAMRKANVAAGICRGIYEGCVQILRAQNGVALYAIMPPYMIRLVGQAGVRARSLDCRFRTEDPTAARFFHEFSVYFHHAAPKLYEFPDAPNPLTTDY